MTKLHNDLYSMIVWDDIDVVDAIMNKHGVKCCADNFCRDMGYIFIVQEVNIGEHPVIKELLECPKVHCLSFAYATSAKNIDEFMESKF